MPIGIAFFVASFVHTQKSVKNPAAASNDKGKREASRVDVQLPIKVGMSPGFTHNISATGVYFETEDSQTVGSSLSFSVQLILDGDILNLVCQGQVVRVTEKNGKTGVAARIESSFFEPI